MKKVLLSVLLAGIMVCSMAACGGSSASGNSSSKDHTAEVDEWVVGYSNRDDTGTYLKMIMDEFQKLVDEDDTLSVVFADAETDSQTQLNQLDNFIIQGVNCVVIVPQDSASVVDFVKQCNDDAIPVFACSIGIDGGENTFVGASDYDIGVKQGEWAYKNLEEGSKILYLGGTSGYQTSDERREGLIEGLGDRLYTDAEGNVLNKNGDLEILSWQECDYTSESGMQIMEDWIQTFDDFDCVMAVNDSSLMGAMEALKGAGITDCTLVGIDGIEDCLNAVKEGTVACTIMQDAKLHAEALYEAVKTAQEGKTNPESVNPDVITITSENVDEYLQ